MGTHFCFALGSNDTIWAWGKNNQGQLADGTTASKSTAIHSIGPCGAEFNNIIEIAAGNGFSMALKSDGTLWTWGANNNGRLGDGTTTGNRTIPKQVVGPGGTGYLNNMISIGESRSSAIALKSNGTVWAWGYNGYGQIGNGTTTDQYTPTQVFGPGSEIYLTNIIAVDGGDCHFIALKSDSTLYAWGYNGYGGLGDGSTTHRNRPVRVPGPGGEDYLDEIVAISGGVHHTLALKSDGTVFAWGRNDRGQLGNGNTTNQTYPVRVKDVDTVSNLSGVIAISAGDMFSLALKSDGSVWAWGWNNYGQLGDGTTAEKHVPVQVLGAAGGYLENIVAISTGYYYFSMALKSDGTVWAWGRNDNGQLGDGSTSYRTRPVRVSGIECTGSLENIIGIATGEQHSIALQSDHTIVSWGYNGDGRLGDGTWANRYCPVEVIAPSLTMEIYWQERQIRPAQSCISVFPNPFNSSCRIVAPANAKTEIFDIAGKRLVELPQGTTNWMPGKNLGSGIYLVRATTKDGQSATKRIVYMK